jgi:hypothetical protein
MSFTISIGGIFIEIVLLDFLKSIKTSRIKNQLIEYNRLKTGA